MIESFLEAIRENKEIKNAKGISTLGALVMINLERKGNKMRSSTYYSSPIFEARREIERDALMARREIERLADIRNHEAVERAKRSRILS